MVVDKVKAVHPEVPVIIYINKSGALLERMATSGVDIVSLDWTVTVPEARKRIGEARGGLNAKLRSIFHSGNQY